jgi:hypothetical protein
MSTTTTGIAYKGAAYRTLDEATTSLIGQGWTPVAWDPASNTATVTSPGPSQAVHITFGVLALLTIFAIVPVWVLVAYAGRPTTWVVAQDSDGLWRARRTK